MDECENYAMVHRLFQSGQNLIGEVQEWDGRRGTATFLGLRGFDSVTRTETLDVDPEELAFACFAGTLQEVLGAVVEIDWRNAVEREDFFIYGVGVERPPEIYPGDRIVFGFNTRSGVNHRVTAWRKMITAE